ncbi:hypothetical protein MsAm2_04410 [Methanolapillus ohkumae]|uniref:TM2 domain-containing protein n=2 Tax=Methanolapillus ohkumae TaxID=3028298 RepID=A0AA96V542_9EURY|nr:hypothetical protein MsAm2_04410 [Methanosarcinaceae archaeon Am2]
MASQILAAIFSFFIPGLGQFYAGNFLRGAMIFIGFIILGAIAAGSVLSVVGSLVGGLIGIFMFLLWLWNIFDAYQLAK